MNFREKQRRKVRAVSSIKLGDRHHTNCYRIFAKETQMRHELAKFALYLELRMMGHTVYVEPTFYNLRGRADVLDITTHTIWEVVNTEKEESIEMKKDTYPEMFDIIAIQADRLLKQLSKVVNDAMKKK